MVSVYGKNVRKGLNVCFDKHGLIKKYRHWCYEKKQKSTTHIISVFNLRMSSEQLFYCILLDFLDILEFCFFEKEKVAKGEI